MLYQLSYSRERDGLGNRRRGGGEGNRTPDLLNAIQALSQLSYGPHRNPEAAAPRDFPKSPRVPPFERAAFEALSYGP